jgi:DNA-binding XRE family transcriptional regulator
MLVIFHKKYKFAENNHQMKSKKQVLFPKYQRILEQLGENIKLARKRRRLTTIQVAERAGVDRSTLYEIEKGTPSVSMGAYFNTLRVLGLQDDFLKLASDDAYGRKLQDLDLINQN